ncbi:MAG: hypothetical protein GY749_50315 [Desulfobacteraceae bacterium]|nr:hypothetical protein [Desulfobacteraceae bacterium]
MTVEVVKTEEKTEEFFVVRTIKKAKDTYTDKVKEYNEKLKEYNEKFVKNRKEVLKDYNEKYVKNFVETGKDFGEGVKKDTLKVIDLAVEKGKNLIPENTVLETVKEKVSCSVKTVTDKINLPSKQDIEKLTGAVETLNSKVDSLIKN